MQITISNTSKIVQLNQVPARIWEGKTDSGIPVICFITRIAVAKEENSEQFQRELLETRAPSKEVEAFPISLIL